MIGCITHIGKGTTILITGSEISAAEAVFIASNNINSVEITPVQSYMEILAHSFDDLYKDIKAIVAINIRFPDDERFYKRFYLKPVTINELIKLIINIERRIRSPC